MTGARERVRRANRPWKPSSPGQVVWLHISPLRNISPAATCQQCASCKLAERGTQGRNRTTDTGIFSPLLNRRFDTRHWEGSRDALAGLWPSRALFPRPNPDLGESSCNRLAAAAGHNERLEVGGHDADHVHHADVPQPPERAEFVDCRGAHPEPLRDLPHGQQALDPAGQLVQRGWDWR